MLAAVFEESDGVGSDTVGVSSVAVGFIVDCVEVGEIIGESEVGGVVEATIESVVDAWTIVDKTGAVELTMSIDDEAVVLVDETLVTGVDVEVVDVAITEVIVVSTIVEVAPV